MRFRRAVQRYGRTPEPETPFQRAGQLWDERIGSARVQARNWRVMAFGGLLLSAGLSGGLLWQSMQSRVIPYVVEVDSLGEARAVAPAAAEYRPTDPQIAWHLARFIMNVRSISLDPVLMRENWLSAYDFATERGARFLSEYARTANPFAAVGDRTVSVQVTSVVRASDRSFQIKWTETAYERGSTAAEAERQRRAAAREAARSSGLLVERSGGGEASLRPAQAAGDREGAPYLAPASVPAEGGGRGGAASGGPEAGAVNPHELLPPPSPWTLSAGTIIPASLVTGLNSDLPGTVIAQVTENVRDSATGRTVLVPQGARLIGSYGNVAAFGQRRALLVWQRIVFPDGSSIRLDDVPAADLSGYSGLADKVDFHTWRLLSGIALSTLLGVGTELGLGSGESDLVRAVRESAQQNTARAGERIVERNLDVPPTITVRPGWPLRAVIHKDLVLRPWRG